MVSDRPADDRTLDAAIRRAVGIVVRYTGQRWPRGCRPPGVFDERMGRWGLRAATDPSPGNVIHVDPKLFDAQSEDIRIQTLVHECFHQIHPEWSQAEVERAARAACEAEFGYVPDDEEDEW